MKRIIFFVLAVIAVIGSVFMVVFYLGNLETIAPTEEGVYVKQPYFFGSPGVEEISLTPGKHFIWPADRLVKFTLTPTTVEEPFLDIPSSDNVQMDFHLYAKIRLKQGRSPVIYKKLGMKWYADSVQKPFRTIARNKVREYTADELRLSVTKLDECEEAIRKEFDRLLVKVGAEYVLEDITIGGVTPPDDVLAESARTAAQKQRKKTEVAREQAETSRKAAETAAADADQEYMNQMDMSVDQYIRRKEVENSANLIKSLPEITKGGNVSIIMGNATPAVNASPN